MGDHRSCAVRAAGQLVCFGHDRRCRHGFRWQFTSRLLVGASWRNGRSAVPEVVTAMRKWRCHKLESNKRIGLWVWASASGQGKCCACARNPGSSLDSWTPWTPLDSGLRLGGPHSALATSWNPQLRSSRLSFQRRSLDLRGARKCGGSYGLLPMEEFPSKQTPYWYPPKTPNTELPELSRATQGHAGAWLAAEANLRRPRDRAKPRTRNRIIGA